jgi:hypothetical protein
MRISHHADRCHNSEQALNQLLSVQRAVLEQSDEILNGVLHTFRPLGSLHTVTITADAQRPRSAAGAAGPLKRGVGQDQRHSTLGVLNDGLGARL